MVQGTDTLGPCQARCRSAGLNPRALTVIAKTSLTVLTTAMEFHRSRPRSVQKQNRRRSGSCTVIIVEHSAETLAPIHRLRGCDDRGGPQELVCKTLMIALCMVVRHEMEDRVLKRGMSEEDHSVQTLGFYGAHKALGERI